MAYLAVIGAIFLGVLAIVRRAGTDVGVMRSPPATTNRLTGVCRDARCGRPADPHSAAPFRDGVLYGFCPSCVAYYEEREEQRSAEAQLTNPNYWN